MASRNGKSQITFWVSPGDKERIRKKAENAGLTVTELIIRSVTGKKVQTMGDTDLMREYAAQLGKVGSNLNQIARRLNSGEDSYQLAEEAEEAIRDFVDLKFRVMTALEDMSGGKNIRSQ